MSKDLEKRSVFICDCHSLEHSYAIWYDSDYNELHIEPRLILSGNWFFRMKTRVLYLLGHTSRYGSFDDLIINNNDIPKISKYLDKVIEVEKEKTASLGRD
jgi:hypothetical protein